MFIPAPAVSTVEVNICVVMQRPSIYRGKMIHVHAGVFLALPHGAILVDDACPKAVVPLGAYLSKAEPSAINLADSILSDCSSGDGLHAVEGVFTGKLAYSRNGRIFLRLASVSNLHVQPCSVPDPVVLPDKGDDGELLSIFQPH